MSNYRSGSKRRWLVGLIAGLSVAAAHAAAPSSPAPLPPNAKKVVVATGVDPAFAPYVIAVRKGFFQDEGIAAEFKSFDDGNVALDSLLTGAADVGGTSELGGIVRVARGGKLYLVASGTQYADFFGVVGKSTIKSPKDLEGKPIGVPRGSGAHLYLAKYAAFHKLDLGKMNLKFLQAPESVAALARGDIEAFFLWDPWLTRAAETVPNTRIIARSGQDNVFRLNTYVWFSQRLIDDKDLGQRVLRALVKAGDWTMANRDEAAKVVADAYHMQTEVAKKIMDPMKWHIHYDSVFLGYLTDAAEFGKSVGIVQKLPANDTFVRPELLQAVDPDRVKQK